MISIESSKTDQLNNSVFNPELRDSVYTSQDIERLRYIARLCPFVEGGAVYTARVILHAFEPDSSYYNYCEFAKKPDRESSERNSNAQQNQVKENAISSNLEYKVIPNPNNGSFSLLCPDDSNITIIIYDSKGGKVYELVAKPSQSIVNIDLDNSASGIYNMIITAEKIRNSIKFAITK
jgi:hypothetical protein